MTAQITIAGEHFHASAISMMSASSPDVCREVTVCVRDQGFDLRTRCRFSSRDMQPIYYCTPGPAKPLHLDSFNTTKCPGGKALCAPC